VFPWRSAVAQFARKQALQKASFAEQGSIHPREQAVLGERLDLLQGRDVLAQEFEHRLVNSLQILVSFLLLQSRNAGPEAAAQLTSAAKRVTAFGCVHRRLHRLDHHEVVEFKEFLSGLCRDLSDLFFHGDTASPIVVEACKMDIPTRLAIPLGFIVNELITNAAKYAEGNILVRLETNPILGHSLSVSDDGPGLPAGFDPARSKGLGMRIVNSLVRQIDGKLQTTAGEGGRGARCTVTFCTPR
jgi:two-component sensor histidine kinase